MLSAIFDFNREKSREMTVEQSKWIATAKGLSIALLGAGVGYGCQSVFVNQLAAQEQGLKKDTMLLLIEQTPDEHAHSKSYNGTELSPIFSTLLRIRRSTPWNPCFSAPFFRPG